MIERDKNGRPLDKNGNPVEVCITHLEDAINRINSKQMPVEIDRHFLEKRLNEYIEVKNSIQKAMIEARDKVMLAEGAIRELKELIALVPEDDFEDIPQSRLGLRINHNRLKESCGYNKYPSDGAGQVHSFNDETAEGNGERM